ncbi:NAD(P)-dependent oxidoreductase [Oceanibacterium hippocampi]|uniref:NAD(P)-dependent oxidoreductase n=1 Tax=Oceanibacterium hippocampi TaxID=745714 RepID=UPI001C38667D|nr:NAD(P)-dependent oxidoreductase [Oceanibacterium hippocampi]
MAGISENRGTAPGTVAFIGYGEAAQAFVAGWGAGRTEAIVAYDIKTDSADAAIVAAKRADYARTGITGAASLAGALAGAAAIFSTVTADQALVAAEAAAPGIGAGALYFDCNSCSPESKRRAALSIEAAGGRYVDTAVMAPVHPGLHRTPLLVAGPHAAAALERLGALGMNAQAVEGPVGAASSIKMVRSIMIKGMEALFLECVLTGRKAGVDETVLASLEKSFPGFDVAGRAAYMMSRAMIHGTRRAAEMREVARTVEELGLAPRMAAATVGWQAEIGGLGLPMENDDYRVLADALIERIPSKDEAA